MNLLSEKHDALKADFLVVKSNFFNETYIDPTMTLVEYKIITIGLSKLSPLANSLHVRFAISDFCRLVGVDKNGMYSYLKPIVENLQRKIYVIEDEGKYIAKSWFDEVNYDKNDSSVNIIFHKDLRKHLFEIEIKKRKDGKGKGYTRYEVENIIFMKTRFSMKTYEILKQCEKMRNRTIEIKKFKKMIGAVKKSHIPMNMFRKNVLKKVISEINILSDIYITCEEKMEGRKVTSLTFHIQPNKLDKNGNFDVVTKDRIILRIQNQILQKTGFIFDAKHVNKIHRKILLELSENFDKGKYDKILVQYPEKFFINEIKLTMEKYDMEKFIQKFEDF